MQSDKCQLPGPENSSAPTRTTEIEVIGNFFSYQAKGDTPRPLAEMALGRSTIDQKLPDLYVSPANTIPRSTVLYTKTALGKTNHRAKSVAGQVDAISSVY